MLDGSMLGTLPPAEWFVQFAKLSTGFHMFPSAFVDVVAVVAHKRQGFDEGVL